MANDKLAVLQAEETVKELNQVAGAVDVVIDSFTDLLGITKKLNTSLSSGKPKEYAEATKKLNEVKGKVVKTAEKERLAEIKLQQAREKAFDNFEKQLQRQEKARIRDVKAAEKQLKAQEKANVSREKARIRLKAQNDAYGKLNKTQAESARRSQRLGAILIELDKRGQTNTKRFKELSNAYLQATANAKGLDSQLKRLENRTGKGTRDVGNYATALNGLSKVAGALGIIGVADTFIRLGGDALSTIIDFEDQINKLGAISGATTEDLKRLEDQSLELGATTAFTATEVAGLQIELAKIGFGTDEIQLATKDIIDLSIALDTEASRAAALAGSQLRAFNLEATETKRVANVLGIATTKSALDIEKLESSLRMVSPVASTFGFSIEEVVALLGTLSNAGFRGEQAGTALRNILLNLADSNGKLAKELGGNVKSFDELIPSLIKLREEGIDLNDTLELTDKRSVAAFNRFLDGAESTSSLKDELSSLDNELSDLADKRLDTVAGKMKLLTSAWEGFILSMNEGSGVISESLKVLLDGITGAIEISKEFNESIVSTSGRLLKLGEIIIDVNSFLYDLTDGFIGVEKQLSGVDKDIMNTITMFNNLVAQPQNINLGVEPLPLPFDFSSTIDRSESSSTNTVTPTLRRSSSRSNSGAKKAQREAEKAQKEKIKLLKEERKELQKINDQLDENKDNYEVAVIRERVQDLRDAKQAIEESLQKTSGDISEGSSVGMVDIEGDEQIKKAEQLLNIRDAIADGFANMGLDELANQFASFFDSIVDQSNQASQDIAAGLSVGLAAAGSLLESQSKSRIESINAENEAFQESTDLKISDIDKQLEAENLSAEEIEQLENEKETFEAQKRQRDSQTKRQQYIAEQNASANQALINGALGATTTIAKLGIPFGLPSAAISLAFGLAQSTLIRSKPIPEFYTGTSNAPEGYAWTQERGAEIIVDKKGNIKTMGTNKGREMTYLEKGDKVYTASQSKNMVKDMIFDNDMLTSMALNGLSTPNITHIEQKGLDEGQMRSIMDGVKKTIKDYATTTIHEQKGRVFTKKGNGYWKESAVLKPSNNISETGYFISGWTSNIS